MQKGVTTPKRDSLADYMVMYRGGPQARSASEVLRPERHAGDFAVST